YVNRFADPTLDYLNARYYDSARGQFLTEDPVFWSSKQNLADPQSFNTYSYANDNPITGKDPDGLQLTPAQSAKLSAIQSQLLAISDSLKAKQCFAKCLKFSQ